jgi:bifunctional non-homologous end joining protein LigD
MPEFIPPQLCTLVDRAPEGPEWLHEIKYDGYRMQVRVRGGRVRIYTRNGLDWTHKFPTLANACRSLSDCVLDGELVVFDAQGVSDFSALQDALERGNGALRYIAFDVLIAKGRDVRALPLEQRRTLLAALLKSADPMVQEAPLFTGGGRDMHEAACRLSLEGVVSKRRDAPYRSGRSGTWTKAKCRAGQEVIIGGWASDGGRLRSLLVGVRKDGRLVYAGRVGTGFPAHVADPLVKTLEAHAQVDAPFNDAPRPRAGETVHWARPDLVAEIAFAGWTSAGIVRQASFKGLRQDKPAAEIKMERAEKKETESAPQARAAIVRTKGVSVAGVSISHPDKIYWPAQHSGEPILKRDLIAYLESMGEHMLAHLRGRPCSLVRAPDGIHGAHFFQRHAMAGTSAHVTLVPIKGEKRPYVQLDTLKAIIASGQSGAIEFHPWNCREGRPDQPGRLVFDLDPGEDVSFSDVVRAAHDVRARLESLGLQAFCKTTGGKGLHVVTPIVAPRGRTLTWPEAKSFAHDLCLAMAADAPGRYVVTMAKKVRTGRIFLDYLRNDRTATAVAPFSPRAREGAPVSMPITWSQVTARLNPARFTMTSAHKLMRKDAWDGYAQAARPLPGGRNT